MPGKMQEAIAYDKWFQAKSMKRWTIFSLPILDEELESEFAVLYAQLEQEIQKISSH